MSSVAPGAAAGATVDYLSTPRYSQQTYSGRVMHFFSVIDPATLLASRQRISDSVKLLDNYKAGQREGITQEQVWNAKKIKVSNSAAAWRSAGRSVDQCAAPNGRALVARRRAVPCRAVLPCAAASATLVIICSDM